MYVKRVYLSKQVRKRFDTNIIEGKMVVNKSPPEKMSDYSDLQLVPQELHRP